MEGVFKKKSCPKGGGMVGDYELVAYEEEPVPRSEPLEPVDLVDYDTSPKVRFYDMDEAAAAAAAKKRAAAVAGGSLDSDQAVCNELLRHQSLQRMSAVVDSSAEENSSEAVFREIMKHKSSDMGGGDSLDDVDASAIFSRTSSEAGSFVMSSMAKKRPVTSKFVRTKPTTQQDNNLGSSEKSNEKSSNGGGSSSLSDGKTGGPGPPGPSPVHYPNANVAFQPSISHYKRPLSAKSGATLYSDKLFEHCSNPTGKCNCSVSSVF